MKYLTLIVFACLLCTGCSTYQYATVSSTLNNQNPESFIAENDTAKITYEFNGQDGPVKISIYNKLETPLYIDWSQSALIVNNTRKSYASKNAALDAEVNSTQSRWLSSTTQSGTIQGTITTKEVSGFIPPRAWARESQLTLTSSFLPLSDQTIQKTTTSGVITRTGSYTREHSPFTFRSYLTLSTHADFSAPIHFDHEFWVSEITQTQSGPKNFPSQSNRFYIKKTNDTGTYVLGAGAGVAAIVFVMSMQDNKKASLD